MAEPQSLASGYPNEIWAVLGGCVGIIIVLVSVLYQRLNKDNEELAETVDDQEKEIRELHDEMLKLRTEHDKCKGCNG